MQKNSPQKDEAQAAAGKTDWAAFDAMTEDEIMAAALSDPDAQPLPEGAKMHPMAKSKRIRFNLLLSREEFAERFQIPLATVVSWERYETKPDPVAVAYLTAIAGDPEGVAKALMAAPVTAQAAE